MDWSLFFCAFCVVPSVTLGYGGRFEDSDSDSHRSRRNFAKKIVQLARRNSRSFDPKSFLREVESIPPIENTIPAKLRNNLLTRYSRNKWISKSEDPNVVGFEDVIPDHDRNRLPFRFRKSNNHVLNAVRKMLKGEFSDRHGNNVNLHAGKRQKSPLNDNVLPKSEQSHPGHTLIRPHSAMLKSSAKYPQKEESALVYGNLDNLGMRLGDKIPKAYRIMFSDFRKHHDKDDDDVQAVLNFLKHNGGQRGGRRSGHLDMEQPEQTFTRRTNTEAGNSRGETQKLPSATWDIIVKSVLDAVKKNNLYKYGEKSPLIKVAVGPSDLKTQKLNFRPLQNYLNLEDRLQLRNRDRGDYNIDDNIDDNDNDNKASEILDTEEQFDRFRRRSKKKDDDPNNLFSNCTGDSSSDSDSSSSGERNPGNPYTVFKGKYKQNWLWNHFMDGDHMNINPFGPQFNSLGPSGTELFFNRKWWYFNQDDFKPFR